MERCRDLQMARLNVECLMLRGIFMPPGATMEQVDYYVDLSKKVSQTSEWKDLKEGAFKQTFMAGDEYVKWVEVEEKRHQTLMKEAGFLANSNHECKTKGMMPIVGGSNPLNDENRRQNLS